MADQPLTISGPTPFDSGARFLAARQEDDRSGQNAQIADKLRQAADILAAQGADPFRIAAYPRAAESILILNDDIGVIAARGGREALEAVPFIGTMCASLLRQVTARHCNISRDRRRTTSPCARSPPHAV